MAAERHNKHLHTLITMTTNFNREKKVIHVKYVATNHRVRHPGWVYNKLDWSVSTV